LDASGRVVDAERLAEAADRFRHDGFVEAQRRRQAERIRGAVCDPVAAAERLGHRVAEREPGRAERGAGVLGALQQARAGGEIVAVGQYRR
jgi:hypothetical protein